MLIEYKGDDRDNSDSERKLKPGRQWQANRSHLQKNTPLPGTVKVPGRGLSLFTSQNPPKPKKPGSWPL